MTRDWGQWTGQREAARDAEMVCKVNRTQKRKRNMTQFESEGSQERRGDGGREDKTQEAKL